MPFEWDNNSLSIILLPSEDRYPKVHEQLKQWIADGLLGNFIWMTADSIKTEKFGPITVEGTVWGLDEDRELVAVHLDPFEEMAKNQFDFVRVIAVRVRQMSWSTKNLISLQTLFTNLCPCSLKATSLGKRLIYGKLIL